jgi:hypothetical protein
MVRFLALALVIISLPAFAGKPKRKAPDGPTISYSREVKTDEERPVATAIVAGPQGTDIALKVTFNGPVYGEECRTRCANTTLYIDTDAVTGTGLSLKDETAAENGSDVVVFIQGVRELGDANSTPQLKVRVKSFVGKASLDSGNTLAELLLGRDDERMLLDGQVLYLLLDATSGAIPLGKKMRVVYHPPDSPALVGQAPGLMGNTARLEIFKSGRLVNPVKRKKSDYEKL